ncbi:MAG TPA: hypothetical protein VMG58_05700, partial [Candidatus Sulfotelmatobacter sp.]|nr:hypothetical protein [Candidatus Sulfotelmatobacter sp.]
LLRIVAVAVIGIPVLVLGLRAPAEGLSPEGAPAPGIAGRVWINSPPLTLQALRGRVVLVEFWTYG